MRAFTGFLILLLAGCATAKTYVPGQSLVNEGNPTIRRDVLHVLSVYESALAPKCKLRVVDTQVIEAPKTLEIERGTDLVKAKWVERWTLDRCGSNVTYLIDFDAQGSRGTDIGVRIEDASLTNGVEEIRIK